MVSSSNSDTTGKKNNSIKKRYRINRKRNNRLGRPHYTKLNSRCKRRVIESSEKREKKENLG
jgi:hypothetical protein